MLTARSDSRLFLVVAVTIVGLAWSGIVLWGSSPYATYLHHDALGSVGSPFSERFGLRLVVFVCAWLLMTVAMMLPTSLPLFSLFRTIISARQNRGELSLLLIAGYLSVWLMFGVAAYAADLGVHSLVTTVPWLNDRSWLITAAILIGAGVYQFTPLKYLCLDKCRSPYSFIMSHWHGRNAREEAVGLGVAHGIFCVGCCWTLMLLMFAIGIGSVVWMLGLAGVMGIEKNFSWGRRLSPSLGLLLVVAGLTVAVVGGPAGACAC